MRFVHSVAMGLSMVKGETITPIFVKTLDILREAKPQLSVGSPILFDEVRFSDVVQVQYLSEDTLKALLDVAKLVAPYIGGAFKLAFQGVAGVINGVSKAVDLLVDGINLAVGAVNLLISAYNIVNNLKPGSKDLPKIPKLAMGGTVSANRPYIVGEVGPELFVPSSSGRVVPNNKLGGGTVINVNVTGAIDSEGTARSIINALNNSFYRGTGGAGNFVVAS
jgi:hypothetical protein